MKIPRTLTKSIAVSLNRKDLGVMQKALQNGNRDDLISKDLSPFGKLLLEVRINEPFSYRRLTI